MKLTEKQLDDIESGILADLTDRGGFDAVIDDMAIEDVDDMLRAWEKLIKRALRNA